ncbi:hypothetical protein D3C72_1894320 [compost metagenome]
MTSWRKVPCGVVNDTGSKPLGTVARASEMLAGSVRHWRVSALSVAALVRPTARLISEPKAPPLRCSASCAAPDTTMRTMLRATAPGISSFSARRAMASRLVTMAAGTEASPTLIEAGMKVSLAGRITG